MQRRSTGRDVLRSRRAMDARALQPYLAATNLSIGIIMARSLNKVLLIGNIGAEPEIKTTGSGTKFAKVSLATNRTFSDRSGQQQEKTEWHRLTFWDKLAELVEQ